MYIATRGLGADYGAAGSGAVSGAFQIANAPTVGGKVSGGGTLILSAAPFAGPAAPVVAIAGAVVVIAGQIMSFLGVGDGCGQSCILTSEWAKKAEGLLRANIDAYFNSPVRNQSTQKAALDGFDAIWGQLAQACSNPQLGDAGKNCTGDRVQGACKWKQTGQSPWPGGPALGECWNWFSAYRDPIAKDTGVQPDSAFDLSSTSAAGGSVVGGALPDAGGSNLFPLLVIGGLLAAAVAA